MPKTGEIGERSFLGAISSFVESPEGAVLGFDDDASDVPLCEKNNLVINVDTFVRKTDWMPGMTPAQAGRKTAVMALSDLAAKGAKPMATMLSLCAPQDYDVDDASELVRGFSHYSIESGIPYLGGDIGMCDDVVLTGVALGTAAPGDIVPRSGAGEGDVVAVTGDFGLTSVAFEILIRDKEAEPGLRLRALDAVYSPECHTELIPSLVKIGAVSACMDSSDGLGITLHTLARLSGCGICIDELPTPPEVARFCDTHRLDLLKTVMGGGEEFALVLTVPAGRLDAALETAALSGVPLRTIGRTTAGGGVVLHTRQGAEPISASGYDNFKEWQ
jgi:thiamine-monophosphate kinase